MNTINFRTQIRILMERKGINPSRLSRMVDLHPDTIYKYLREESEMSAANLEKIINTLNSMEDVKPERSKIHEGNTNTTKSSRNTNLQRRI